ncbi:MAG: sensor histidine kinase [Bacillota bacterium]
MKTVMQISDYIDIDVLQSIQNHFAMATSTASVTVDYRGAPITEYSRFSTFCVKLRKKDHCRELCYECDAHGGLQSAIASRPYIYKCHAGLVDFAVPIIVYGTYIGAILCGQVRLPPEDEGKLSNIIDRRVDWLDDPELVAAAADIPTISYDKLLAASNMLYEIANYLVQSKLMSYDREELNQKQRKLIEETHKRIELEKALKEMEWKTLQLNVNPHFLFNALNTVGRLAYLENAPKTEEAMYALAEILRYTLQRSRTTMVALSEEIEFVKNYLKVQSVRFGDRLRYTLDINEDLMGLECPYNTIQPFLENCINYVIEKEPDGGDITIHARAEGKHLVIEISDNGKGIDSGRIQRILEGAEYLRQNESGFGIYSVSKRLNQAYNGEAWLHIESVDDGFPGTRIIITLPLKMR